MPAKREAGEPARGGFRGARPRLYALAQALGNDYGRFKTLVDGRGEVVTEMTTGGSGAGGRGAGGGDEPGRGKIVLLQVIVGGARRRWAGYTEFVAGRIANARTRAAYGRAVGQFLGWCEARGLGLRNVSPLHVAAYIRTHPGSAPTVQAAPHARRLVRRQPDPPGDRVRPEARRHQGVDAGPIARGGKEAPRQHRPDFAGWAPGTGAAQLRAGERGPGDAEAGLLRAGEPGLAQAPRDESSDACKPTP